MSQPRYKHDCYVVGERDASDGTIVRLHHDACRFIGCLREFDLYIHERNYSGQMHHVECVARYSDDGPDYFSGESAKRLIVEFLGDQ